MPSPSGNSAHNPRQLYLFDATPADDVTDVALLITNPENQWFDRKSSRIGADKLAECMIGFANADGCLLYTSPSPRD